MDVQLFQDWVSEEYGCALKKFLRKSDLPEKAPLLVDNAPSHPATLSLQCESIVKFLSFHMTSIVQLMHQGIIVSFELDHWKNL